MTENFFLPIQQDICRATMDVFNLSLSEEEVVFNETKKEFEEKFTFVRMQLLLLYFIYNSYKNQAYYNDKI